MVAAGGGVRRLRRPLSGSEKRREKWLANRCALGGRFYCSQSDHVELLSALQSLSLVRPVSQATHYFTLVHLVFLHFQ